MQQDPSPATVPATRPSSPHTAHLVLPRLGALPLGHLVEQAVRLALALHVHRRHVCAARRRARIGAAGNGVQAWGPVLRHAPAPHAPMACQANNPGHCAWPAMPAFRHALRPPASLHVCEYLANSSSASSSVAHAPLPPTWQARVQRRAACVAPTRPHRHELTAPHQHQLQPLPLPLLLTPAPLLRLQRCGHRRLPGARSGWVRGHRSSLTLIMPLSSTNLLRMLEWSVISPSCSFTSVTGPLLSRSRLKMPTTPWWCRGWVWTRSGPAGHLQVG